MPSQEFVKPDPNREFFNCSYEAAQLEFEIAEKVVGIDTLLAAKDEEIADFVLLTSSSDEEYGAIREEYENSAAIPDFINVGLMRSSVCDRIIGDVERIDGFALTYVEAGFLLFMRRTEQVDRRFSESVIEVRGNGDSTNLEQVNMVTDLSAGFKPISEETAPPEMTLEQVNNYLRQYLAAAKKLLELEPDELKRLIELQT